MKEINNPVLLQAIRDASSVLVFTHYQPDGDAIGSALSLYMMCAALGKRTAVCCQDAPAEKLRFLPFWEVIVPPEKIEQRFDLHLSIDASDLKRLGTAGELFSSGALTAQIDHHATNDGFAMLNEVDVSCAAAGMLALRLITQMKVAVTAEMAMCLYTAISTDTGNFCFPSVTGETFEMAALLMEAGLPLAHCARALHLTKRAGHVLLLGAALSTLHFLEGGHIAGMSLCRADFLKHHAPEEDGEGIVNYGLYIPGVEMAYLATETEGGVKFSLRALEPRNVASVAALFGGGGHALAAGCHIEAALPEAISRMEKALSEALCA